MKKRMMFLGFTVSALILGLGMVEKARAGVRVSATVRTPAITVRVGNTPRAFVPRPLPVRRVYRHVPITHRDREIASRLEWYTGVPVKQMLFMKSRGYTWCEIGHWLGVSDGTVQAAMQYRTWKRFLRAQRHACCGKDRGRHGRHRVVYVERGYDVCDH
jgi:hypothetical protein